MTTIHIVYGCFDYEGSAPLFAYECEKDADDMAALLLDYASKQPKHPDGVYEGPEYDAFMERWTAWVASHPARLVGCTLADSYEARPMDVIAKSQAAT